MVVAPEIGSRQLNRRLSDSGKNVTSARQKPRWQFGCSLSHGRRDIGYARLGVEHVEYEPCEKKDLQTFFIIFVDRIFTTFIQPPFTNALDVTTQTHAPSCVMRVCNAD
jgi:hypothetical protein